jgi:hypothetical protein
MRKGPPYAESLPEGWTDIQDLYDHYVEHCKTFGCKPKSEQAWVNMLQRQNIEEVVYRKPSGEISMGINVRLQPTLH